ncbi:PREDICTED: glutamic acid-rich protein-like [Priapulus caudatus]|uniref:Glutamic acid-rich protein-like n=1 Tax=Priapulus caudatus TaxID=37621 RepID=A0ABM1ESK1_PRICU|nr:PREDICTED: glutamic acid-rich protein-like [Priapulus caudatus]XP_014675173.1 PREDICTED: glutamic acid-rich protein-like [Priapulus caudatus]XP_014675174.1 PREDICTED: glutamic acid-rich protein-like [Priapulus caudatus]
MEVRSAALVEHRTTPPRQHVSNRGNQAEEVQRLQSLSEAESEEKERRLQSLPDAGSQDDQRFPTAGESTIRETHAADQTRAPLARETDDRRGVLDGETLPSPDVAPPSGLADDARTPRNAGATERQKSASASSDATPLPLPGESQPRCVDGSNGDELRRMGKGRSETERASTDVSSERRPRASQAEVPSVRERNSDVGVKEDLLEEGDGRETSRDIERGDNEQEEEEEEHAEEMEDESREEDEKEKEGDSKQEEEEKKEGGPPARNGGEIGCSSRRCVDRGRCRTVQTEGVAAAAAAAAACETWRRRMRYGPCSAA